MAAGRRVPPSGPSRTAALYFRLAAAAPDDDRLRALLDGFGEWDALRALARRDGVTAAVRRRLRAAGAAVPADETAALGREADVLDFHRLQLERRLGDVLALLDREGLRPVLLKGAGLAHTAYRRAVDRPMRDLDLLLPAGEAEAAVRFLAVSGWRPTEPDSAVYAEHQHLPPLREPGAGSAVIEVHRELFAAGHPFALDAAGIRRRAREVRTPHGPVLVPAPEDQLVHACLHFAWAHELRWGFWQLAGDVAALGGGAADRPGAGVSWRGVVDRARGARGAAGTFWALRLAERVGGAAVPAEVLAALRPPLAAGAERALLRHYALQLAPGVGNVPSVALGRRLWEAGMRPAAAGHGGARPWAVGVPGRVAAGRPPLGVRVRGQLGRLAAWGRYCRAVLASGPAG